ncbi:MAG: DNA primase subunit pri2 [Sporothrix thermara]
MSTQLAAQRKKDHYSHFILRLAFSSTEDLRRRFSRLETMLFRLRLSTDDMRERAAFIQSLNLDWEMVSDDEKSQFAVFEFAHRNEIRRAKDEGIMTAAQLETIVHPNEYFKRSYLLKNLNKSAAADTVADRY